MGAGETAGRSGIRVNVRGSGVANVETGIPVLDQLLERLAESAGFDLVLEVEPGEAEAEVTAAGRALGEALAGPLRAPGARGFGSAFMTSSEALAHVALEASDTPLVVSNVDLTEARIGGLGTDVARRFLERLADAAGLTLHVRLLNGKDTQHVLEAMFKALGVALAQACETKRPVADKSVVRTEAAPAPFQGAPYSQAIRAGGFVFVSGQLALRPGDKELSGGSIEEQTEQVFANLGAILAEAGTGLDRLVKTTVFLQNLGDFQGMNSVYAKHVGEQPPARSTVEVAALPSGALVEIEAIALA